MTQVHYTRHHPCMDFIAAVINAESQARANHDAGICHLDEWSCSYCEADEGA